MKRSAIVLGLWVGLIAVFGSYPAHAGGTDLDESFLRYKRSLATVKSLSNEQQTLLAASLASAETGVKAPSAPHFPSLLSRVDTTEYLRSDTSFEWTIDSTWAGTSRTSYTYDGSNQRTNEVIDTFGGSSWAHAFQAVYTYNGSGKIATLTQLEWVSGAWTNHYQSTYSYDGSGNITQGVTQVWTSGAWVNFSRSTNTITSGKLMSTLLESWVSSAWVNSTKFSYSYDGSNHETQFLIQSWQASAWVNQSRATYTYNGSGDRTGSLDEFWQSNAWSPSSKHGYGYNGSHLEVLDTTSTWLGALWFPMTVDSTKYSGSLVTEVVTASLLGAGSSRVDYTYDTQGNETAELQQSWNMGTDQWDNTARTVYVWTTGGQVSCCVGRRGNVNATGIIDLVDLSSLVNYLTGGGFVLPCPEAANVNGTGIIDLVDLSSLVNYLTGGGYVPPNCP
jgi:hypothetical protein